MTDSYYISSRPGDPMTEAWLSGRVGEADAIRAQGHYDAMIENDEFGQREIRQAREAVEAAVRRATPQERARLRSHLDPEFLDQPEPRTPEKTARESTPRLVRRFAAWFSGRPVADTASERDASARALGRAGQNLNAVMNSPRATPQMREGAQRAYQRLHADHHDVPRPRISRRSR